MCFEKKRGGTIGSAQKLNQVYRLGDVTSYLHIINPCVFIGIMLLPNTLFLAKSDLII